MTYNKQAKLICKEENLGKHYFGFFAINDYVQNDFLIEDLTEAINLHNEYLSRDDGTFVSPLNEYVVVRHGYSKGNFQFDYIKNIQ